MKKLLGDVSRHQSHRIRIAQAGRHARDTLLLELLRAGNYKRLLDLVRWDGREHLLEPLNAGVPVIAASWHIGPTSGAGLGFLQLELPMTTVIRKTRLGSLSPLVEVVSTEAPDGAPALAFRRCLARLKAKGLVGMAGDALSLDEDDPLIECFGLALRFKRGIASLSYLTGARVVPVSVEWSADGGLLFRAQPALESSLHSHGDRQAYEYEVVREFVARMETYARTHPQDLRPGAMGKFLRNAKLVQRRLLRTVQSDAFGSAADAAAGKASMPADPGPGRRPGESSRGSA